jgi:hypothetical protein
MAWWELVGLDELLLVVPTYQVTWFLTGWFTTRPPGYPVAWSPGRPAAGLPGQRSLCESVCISDAMYRLTQQ